MTNTNTAEQTYLYSVHPRTVIKELPVAPIRVPKSLYLTKDQVLICLKHGAVYRRFANEGKNERVTIINVDRLHNEKFMTEEQYAAFLQSGVADNRGTTIGDTTVTPDNDKEPEKDPEVEPVKENESVETTETEKSEDNTPEQTAEPAAENEEDTETTEEEDECAACNIDYSQLESTETTEEETVEESTEQEVKDESASESVEAVVEQANSNSQQNYNNDGKNKHGKHHR